MRTKNTHWQTAQYWNLANKGEKHTLKKRENFLNKPEIYSEYEKEQLRKKEKGEQCFIEYFRKLANKRKASNHDNWVSALNYIEAFTNDGNWSLQTSMKSF